MSREEQLAIMIKKAMKARKKKPQIIGGRLGVRNMSMITRIEYLESARKFEMGLEETEFAQSYVRGLAV